MGTGTHPLIEEQHTALPDRERLWIWQYYAMAFGITWGVGGLSLLASLRYPGFVLSRANPLLYLAACGPSIAGLVMTARTQGRAAVGRLIARAIPRHSSLHWYLLVIVVFFTARLIIAWMIGTAHPATLAHPASLLYLVLLTLLTDPGPLGEEFGWRGFALPRLMRLRSPLIAAIMLGAVWALWHLPAFFIPTLSQSRLSFPIFVLNSISLSVIMTWLYLRARGDLFLMILIHTMANTRAGDFDIPFTGEVIAEILCAALIVAAGGFRRAARRV